MRVVVSSAPSAEVAPAAQSSSAHEIEQTKRLIGTPPTRTPAPRPFEHTPDTRSSEEGNSKRAPELEKCHSDACCALERHVAGDICAPPATRRASASRPSARVRVGKARELAEREGFEPPVGLLPHLISSQAHSTRLWHLSARNLEPGRRGYPQRCLGA